MYSYAPTVWDAVASMNLISICAVMDTFQSFVPCCVTLLVCLNFQVRIEKEIEVSKSGTASTSSASSSHASSLKSSSSSADPVIEL